MISLKSLLGCFILLSLSMVQAGTQSFSVSSKEAYAPATITFDASEINQAKKYLWTFGDGGTLTTTNSVVSYQYKNAGNFTASLSYQVNASDKNPNYKDAGFVAIKILARPVSNPTASLSCSINNLLVNCNALGSTDPQGKPLAFLFSYGDNFSESNTTGLSSHVFSAAGLYSVTLTVMNSAGLSSTATTQVQAVLPPNVFPNLVLNCSSDVINTLSCNSNGSVDSDGTIVSYKYTWDDNTSDSKADSSTITHLFSTSGNHTVTLTAVDNDGGVSTLSKSFSVKANTLPVANFSCDTSKPQRVTCSSTSTDADPGDSIQSYSWKFGSASAFSTTTPNTDYDFKTGGSFDVTLSVTDSYGGVGSVTKTIAVKNNTPPVASFSCSNAGVRAIHCDSTSTDSDGSIVSTSWSFDDGTNLTGASFDHTYSDDQAHVVNLLVTDDLGANTSSDQTVQPLQNQAPQLDISASTLTGVAPLAINFTANALDVDGVVSGVSWSYSDGGSDFGANPAHTFSTPGTYTVTATVTDNFGATTTKSLSITVTAPIIKIPPAAFFKVYEFDTWVELHSTLTKAQYDIKRAYYTIDGASTVEVTEFYPNTINWIDLKTFGWHEIKLTVVDIYGQQSTFTQQVNQVEDLDTLAPFVDFKIQQSAARTVFLNFNRSFDYDIDQGIQSFHVDYGNGESEDTTNLYLTHTYSAAGIYTITVTATTIHATQNTTSKQITITDSAPEILPPFVNFGYRIYDFAQNVSFYNDKSGTPNGTILSYVWDFGDGQTATGQKVAHFYDPGSYFVTLTIVDSLGQSSSQTQHITIFETGSNLVAQLGCDIAKPYFDYIQTCQVFALDKQNQITRVRVNWGDGTANNLTLPSVNGIFRPTHKYADAGTYTVTETVTTSRGEITTATTTLALTKYNPIVANIQCTTNNLLVSCNALGSYSSDGLPLLYIFDFGDSYIETNSTGLVSHNYSSAGTYSVKLTVTNGLGSFSDISTSVMALMPVNIPPVADGFCNSYSALSISCFSSSYDPDNSSDALTIEWDIDSNSYFGNFFTAKLANGGAKLVTLKVTDSQGGIATKNMYVFVLDNIAPIAIAQCSLTDATHYVCISNSSDQDGNITNTKWTLANGVVYNGNSFSSELSEGQSILNFILEVTDNFGATTRLNKTIDFKDPSYQSTPDSEKCPIAQNIKNKLCSNDYYLATNESDLTDYLSNGKYDSSGKLLNLEIGYNLNQLTSLATPCQIKISNHVIQSGYAGICLRASSLAIANQAQLTATNNGSIDIFADLGVLVDHSTLQADSYIKISTSKYDPFDGLIEIKNGSSLAALYLKIDTKSSVSKDQNSNLLAETIILNGGDCKLNEVNYEGTCSLNPLPENITINESIIDSTNNLALKFELSDGQAYETFWRFNNDLPQKSELSLPKNFTYPGTYLSEAIIQDSNGYFRKMKKIINVLPNKYKPYQVAIFSFFGVDKNQSSIPVIFNGTSNTLEGGGNGLFMTLLEGTSSNSLLVSNLNYIANLNVDNSFVIDNSDAFVNSKLDEILTNINSSSDIDSSLKESIVSKMYDVKTQYLSLSDEDKLIFAYMLSANIQTNLDGIVLNTKAIKNFHFSNLFVDQAYALTSDEIFNFDSNGALLKMIAIDLLNELKTIGPIVGAGVGGAFVVSRFCKKGLVCGLLQIAAAGVASTFIAKFVHAEQLEINKIYIPNPDKFLGKVIGDSLAGETTIIQLESQYIPLDSPNINSVNINKGRDKLVELNQDIQSTFEAMGEKPTINDLLKFPQDTFQERLSARYVGTASYKLIAPLDGSVSIDPDSFIIKGDNINVIFKAAQTQTAIVRVTYDNPDYGIKKDIDIPVNIIVKTNSGLEYKTGNRDVKLDISLTGDISNYILDWDFGDGNSERSIESTIYHRYSSEGEYHPKLKVYDDNLKLVGIYETDIIIRDFNFLDVCDTVEYMDLLEVLIDPTTRAGYIGQIEDNVYGTCFVKGSDEWLYFSSDGQANVCLKTYNCTYSDLIK